VIPTALTEAGVLLWDLKALTHGAWRLLALTLPHCGTGGLRGSPGYCDGVAHSVAAPL